MATCVYFALCCLAWQGAPGDEPVWRQVVLHLSNNSDLAVPQQAATALASHCVSCAAVS